MRKIQLLLLGYVLSPVAVFSQLIYSNSFFYYDTLACPFDSSKTIITPKNWYLYQTTDGTWEGPADSTRCISVEPSGSFQQPRVALSQIDPGKPLFLRAKPAEFVGLDYFEANQLYNGQISFHVSNNLALPVAGANCVQDLCSGFFVGIAVPGPTRFHTGLLDNSGLPPTYLYRDIIACFPTEYFFEQQLAEFVAKFTFAQGVNLANEFLHLDYASITPGFLQPGLISEVNADIDNYNPANDEYDVNVAEAVTGGGFFFENFLLQYTAPTFPSAQDPSYVVGTVEPNTPDPQVINLVVDPFQTLEIQPFTYLIGAPVQGNDTLRHQVNLVNNGGDICLNFVDFVLAGGEEYRHGGGNMTFNNAFSCMQFRDGSALRVLEGAALHYGNHGAGMLALCAGGTIVLERNAALTVDCVLNLAECNDALPPQQIFMDLPPGARLVFTDKARLTNRFSQGQQMLLNVRMLGGTIEDWALASEDKALIRRIYPEPSPHFDENVTISPNPFGESFRLIFLAKKPEEVTLRWTTLSGQTVREEKFWSVEGPNEWQPEPPVSAGAYLLTLETLSGKTTKKVMKTGL